MERVRKYFSMNLSKAILLTNGELYKYSKRYKLGLSLGQIKKVRRQWMPVAIRCVRVEI